MVFYNNGVNRSLERIIYGKYDSTTLPWSPLAVLQESLLYGH